MFHAPMGRFQLELIFHFTYFSTVVLLTRHFNDERPTEKKHITVEWDDGGKTGKIIN